MVVWDVMIFPNPASGQLRIYCGSLQIEKAEIFNLIGQGHTLNLVQDNSQSGIADISTLDASVLSQQKMLLLRKKW